MSKLKQLRVYIVLEIFENPVNHTCIHTITYTNGFWTMTLTKKIANVCLQLAHFSEKHLHLMSYDTQRNLLRSNSHTRATFSLEVRCSFTCVATPLFRRRTERRLKQMMITNQYGSTFEKFQNLFFKFCLFKSKHTLQMSFG